MVSLSCLALRQRSHLWSAMVHDPRARIRPLHSTTTRCLANHGTFGLANHGMLGNDVSSTFFLLRIGIRIR